ncbi:hypothetical protein PTTG_25849 [Puccinia triticina 1-1 BBBD Race 1]|uniref:Uncharacterized protein n=1 Tax=Puccinia triticina (isolate 1-1 / race 1 (BBBD)) TaxID=630390 RepID=A0A180GYD1_PUCT1|nr:hypothetical protein PTTG_25849 [Puccinia triticina 1-1 BBBD Race 1]
MASSWNIQVISLIDLFGVTDSGMLQRGNIELLPLREASRSCLFCQDSGPGPESRKRKELNPNPARGTATSSQDEEPKRYKQTLPLSSTLVTDANPDRTGSSSLSNRITNPTSGGEYLAAEPSSSTLKTDQELNGVTDNTRSASLASRIGQR